MATTTSKSTLRTVDAPATSTAASFRDWLNGASKFVEGAVFVITGAKMIQILKDGEDAAPDDRAVHPILTTNLGETDYVWLSSYRTPKLDINNKPVLRDGTVDIEIQKILASVTDTDTFATVLAKFDVLKNRQIRVRRKMYTARDAYKSNGRTASIPCFDFV